MSRSLTNYLIKQKIYLKNLFCFTSDFHWALMKVTEERKYYFIIESLILLSRLNFCSNNTLSCKLYLGVEITSTDVCSACLSLLRNNNSTMLLWSLCIFLISESSLVRCQLRHTPGFIMQGIWCKSHKQTWRKT